MLMGYPTSIEWTDATWNPVGGCSLDSPGCINCWAQQLAGTRLHKHPLHAGTTSLKKGRPIFNGKMTALPPAHDGWDFPLTWCGAASPKLGAGMPSMIFVGDMSDLFHESRPLEHIARVLGRAAVVPNSARRAPHILQLLTKRSSRMRELLTSRHFRQMVQDEAQAIVRRQPVRPPSHPKRLFVDPRWPLPHVWTGVSAERQQEADRRRDDLATLAVAGWTTFVSYEPAIGPANWDGWEFLAWLIAGGEKCRRADQARPSHPDWHRTARDFCKAHGIAFFFKQWGSWRPSVAVAGNGIAEMRGGGLPVYWPDGTIGPGRSIDNGGLGQVFVPFDKKSAGALLDGVEHHAFPAIATRLRTGAAA
jgi:protein gp37